jgi:hypothetical protein
MTCWFFFILIILFCVVGEALTTLFGIYCVDWIDEGTNEDRDTIRDKMSYNPLMYEYSMAQPYLHWIVCPSSFGHCIVCPSSFGHWIVCPSSFGHWIVCPSSFGHWIVCPSSVTIQ